MDSKDILKELINEISNKPMDEQYRAIDQVYHEWTGKIHNQTDDILVMGFKIS